MAKELQEPLLKGRGPDFKSARSDILFSWVRPVLQRSRRQRGQPSSSHSMSIDDLSSLPAGNGVRWADELLQARLRRYPAEPLGRSLCVTFWRPMADAGLLKLAADLLPGDGLRALLAELVDEANALQSDVAALASAKTTVVQLITHIAIASSCEPVPSPCDDDGRSTQPCKLLTKLDAQPSIGGSIERTLLARLEAQPSIGDRTIWTLVARLDAPP